MKLAIFDLDNTLIAGDSDYLWGSYLAKCRHVDGERHFQRQRQFYDAYRQGTLDIHAFLEFQLQILAATPRRVLLDWRDEYVRQYIEPIMLPAAGELIETHRQQGHELMVITATNRFITEPIAKILDIPHLIATEPETHNNEYTGRVTGIPSYGVGKRQRLQGWLDQRGEALEESWFYSDSHTDIPLLEWVDHAVAVDADPRLREHAKKQGWTLCSLRGT